MARTGCPLNRHQKHAMVIRFVSRNCWAENHSLSFDFVDFVGWYELIWRSRDSMGDWGNTSVRFFTIRTTASTCHPKGMG